MMKLGKKPATYSSHDITLDQFKIESTITVPINFGHSSLIHKWNMLGNNTVGDCVFAGAAHETMLWNKETKKTILFDNQGVLSDYSAVTGYNPKDPNTDQGTDVRTALTYRRNTGIIDSANNRHKIGAFASIEPGNWNDILEAAYAFSAVGIGFNFPDYAMDQFNSGKIWTVKPGGTIEGGHYVPIVGHPSKNLLRVVTWGKTQLMSKAFFLKYCDEAWAILSPEFLLNNKSPEGFDLNILNSILASI